MPVESFVSLYVSSATDDALESPPICTSSQILVLTGAGCGRLLLTMQNPHLHLRPSQFVLQTRIVSWDSFPTRGNLTRVVFTDAAEFKKRFENAQIINAGGTPPKDDEGAKAEVVVVEEATAEAEAEADAEKVKEVASEEKKDE